MAVVVVGSANVDLVTCAPRFARPGETLLGSRFEQLFGGKGANQAVAAALLGSRVSMVAKVGADSLGASTLGNFASFGVDAAHVAQTKSAASGIAHVVVDGAGENQIIIVAGANGELAPADVDDADAAIAGARVVLTQLEVPLATTMRALERGRHAGALTVFNAAPAPTEPLPDALFALCDVVCPNETEAAILDGSEDAPRDEECASRCPGDSRQGREERRVDPGRAGLLPRARRRDRVGARARGLREPRPPRDTTGRGDAFLARARARRRGGRVAGRRAPGRRRRGVAVRAEARRPGVVPGPGRAPGGTVRARDGRRGARAAARPTPPRAAAADAAAEAAAAETVDGLVGDGMILGVGTGKTVELCLRRIADKLERGALKDVLCLPTSDATPLLETRKLANLPSLQPAVARLRVGAAPAGFPGCAMPGDDGAAVYKTDNGNLIVDLFLDAPPDAPPRADDLSRTAGVVEPRVPADENPPIVVVGRAPAATRTSAGCSWVPIVVVGRADAHRDVGREATALVAVLFPWRR
ncbi:carbohydrate kinase [Aureococcus anophagefferens]|uniref:Ribokinase n=1 Tax=Aureococcus anophagefferens TaxID=44056 RepID=A0ABR1FR22_AURAN